MLQMLNKFRPRYRGCTQRSKMTRLLLAIDDFDAIIAQEVHEIGQSDLGCIAYLGEHGFPVKHLTNADAIGASDELPLQP